MDRRQGIDPPRSLVTDVMQALNDLCRGDMAEFKVVRTRRGVDVLRVSKRRHGVEDPPRSS